MKKVTGLLLALVMAGALLAKPASAQEATTRNVTFQVDLTQYIASCQFKVGTDSVLIRGSFNDWSNSGTFTKLTDENNDKIYTVTLPLEEGVTYDYKFWLPRADYESGGNRTYTVTTDAEQTVGVATPNITVADQCGTVQKDYEIEFKVDMSVADLGGSFDPATDIVTIAGTMNGWSTTTDTLVASFSDPNVYTKVIRINGLAVPGNVSYKFVIGKPGGNPTGWESISDRVLALTGNEEDIDQNGVLDATNSPDGAAPYFNNVTPADVFTQPATVTFEVDLRPAFYYLIDNGRLPSDTQTGDPVTTLTGLAINGPVAGAADKLADWATWGPNDLGALTSRKLVDDGTNGDRVASDSIYTIVFNYPAGAPRKLVGKLGTDGWDNEAGMNTNHNFVVADGETISVVFGAMLNANGTYTDKRGPTGYANAYDEYIMIDSTAVPWAVSVVRRGGSGTAVEPVDGSVPTSLALQQNYPNPFNPTTTFEYTLDKTQQVRVRVYDVTGRLVETLVDGVQAANTYRVTFDASDLASGMYIYQLQTADRLISKKMLLVK